MQNGDLKRFYPQQDYDKKDFVRLNANAKIPAELIDGGVGTKVVANPTLAGTESALTGLQVGETKYEVMTNYKVIDRVSSLPTATATSPDFIQYNNCLYKKNIVLNDVDTLTDLTGTKWKFTQDASTSGFGKTAQVVDYPINIQPDSSSGYYINFYISKHGTSEVHENTWIGLITKLEPTGYTVILGYRYLDWLENGDVIEITGGTDVTNATLITWLKANATYQPIIHYEAVDVIANPVLAGTENALTGLQVGATKYKNQPASVSYLTTAPTADNTDGLKFVVLTAEPATYYNGYYYIIAPTT